VKAIARRYIAASIGYCQKWHGCQWRPLPSGMVAREGNCQRWPTQSQVDMTAKVPTNGHRERLHTTQDCLSLNEGQGQVKGPPLSSTSGYDSQKAGTIAKVSQWSGHDNQKRTCHLMMARNGDIWGHGSQKAEISTKNGHKGQKTARDGRWRPHNRPPSTCWAAKQAGQSLTWCWTLLTDDADT
jgi:hypothetical protein